MFFFSKFNSGLISEKKSSYLQTLSPLNLSFDLLVDIKSWVFKERSLSVVSLVRNIMLPSLPDFPKVKKKKQILSTFANLAVIVQCEKDLYKHSKAAHSC